MTMPSELNQRRVERWKDRGIRGAALDCRGSPRPHASMREAESAGITSQVKSRVPAGRARSPSLADLIGGRVVEGLVTPGAPAAPEHCHDQPSVALINSSAPWCRTRGC